jgi:hypothetical protein
VDDSFMLHNTQVLSLQLIPMFLLLALSPRLFWQTDEGDFAGTWSQCILGKHHTWCFQAYLWLWLRGVHLRVDSILSSLCFPIYAFLIFKKDYTLFMIQT